MAASATSVNLASAPVTIPRPCSYGTPRQFSSCPSNASPRRLGCPYSLASGECVSQPWNLL
eukprot:607122-Pelagomonas_calceolata.AAC.6